MNTFTNEVRDLRTHDEIMLAARQMRADYLRELFGKLRASLSRAGHGTALPSAR
ncbi:RSP_7527 family protein [Azospirillum endophyticum]